VQPFKLKEASVWLTKEVIKTRIRTGDPPAEDGKTGIAVSHRSNLIKIMSKGAAGWATKTAG
jgi:hypothetical protein